jgi:hypothetical protein
MSARIRTASRFQPGDSAKNGGKLKDSMSSTILVLSSALCSSERTSAGFVVPEGWLITERSISSVYACDEGDCDGEREEEE